MNTLTDNRKKTILLCLKLLHFFSTVVLFYIFWLLFRYGRLNVTRLRGYRYNYFVLLGYTCFVYFFNRTYNAYFLGYFRIRTLALGQFLSQLFSAIIIYIIVSFAWDHFNNPIILARRSIV